MDFNIKDDLQEISKRLGDKNIEKFKGKKVLLIGSDGFLGRWFKDYFASIDVECKGYDIADGFDICDKIDLPRYDYVINCAGIASPEKYLKKPIETMDVSYIGTKNVLEYCIDKEVESILMFSSSEVYGTPRPDKIPTKEDYVGTIPTRSSRSCYDIGKQALETLTYIYHNKYEIPIKIARPFNFYGPHMGIKDNRLLSNWMRNKLSNEDIIVYGDGKQTRTFCYAADGTAILLGVLLNGKDGEVYNVGNPTPELTIKEFAEIFCKTLDYGDKYSVEDYPDFYPSEEPLRRCANIDKVVKQTGVQPWTSLQVGLNKMYEFYKKV